MKLQTIFLILMSVTSNQAALHGAVDFKLCTDMPQTGILSNVFVVGCTTLPCIFRRGDVYGIEIDFENNKYTENLHVEVYGIIDGLTVPWPGLDSNGCNHMLVGRCPMHRGDYVTYGLGMRVDPIYPAVDAILKWLIKGDDQEAIFCFKIPVKLI